MLEMHIFEIYKTLAEIITVTIGLLKRTDTSTAGYNVKEIYFYAFMIRKLCARFYSHDKKLRFCVKKCRLSQDRYVIVWPEELWDIRMDLILEAGTQRATPVTSPQPDIDAYVVMCAFEGLESCIDELEVYIRALKIRIERGQLNGCFVEEVNKLNMYLPQLHNKINVLRLQTNSIEPHRYINRQE